MTTTTAPIIGTTQSTTTLREANSRTNEPAITPIVPFPVHPQVTEVSREALVIKDLPAVEHSRLEESALLNICLGVKKLFKDGDHAGKKAYRRKKRNQEPLENDRFRVCIVYTTQLSKPVEGHQDLKISFWVSNTEDCSYWLGKKGAHRAMTQGEIGHIAELFAQTCADELTAYLDNVYYAALRDGNVADYYAPITD